MKHARDDYNRIQDPENKIPEDEPVFLLRGQDKFAPSTLEFWACQLALSAENLDPNDSRYDDLLELAEMAGEQAQLMRDWQEKVKVKYPDLPGITEADVDQTSKD